MGYWHSENGLIGDQQLDLLESFEERIREGEEKTMESHLADLLDAIHDAYLSDVDRAPTRAEILQLFEVAGRGLLPAWLLFVRGAEQERGEESDDQKFHIPILCLAPLREAAHHAGLDEEWTTQLFSMFDRLLDCHMGEMIGAAVGEYVTEHGLDLERPRRKRRSRPSDAELLKRATTAYFARCDREGWIPQQPSAGASTVSQRRVVLRNVNGVLATYRIRKGRLFYVDPGR